MKIKVKSMNQLLLNARKEWEFNPCERIVNSKKKYTRKIKNWKNSPFNI